MKHPKVLIWLKKARTSLDKIIKMLEEEKYCIDIIQQNLAVIWLLKSANMNLLEWHLNWCVKNAINAKNEQEVDMKIQEIIKIMNFVQKK